MEDRMSGAVPRKELSVRELRAAAAKSMDAKAARQIHVIALLMEELDR